MICNAHINIIRVIKARRMRRVRNVAGGLGGGGGICRKDTTLEDLDVEEKLTRILRKKLSTINIHTPNFI